MSRGPALGRGLNALIPPAKSELNPTPDSAPTLPDESSNPVAALPVGAIQANPDQPRQFFDPSSLEELAASIRENGVLQPILVYATGDDSYCLIAGERRWRAAQLAGLTEIPALITDIADKNVLALALVENIQRQDLSPLEEAHAYRRLIDESELTQEQVAKSVGKSRTTITNSLRLLQLPTPIRMSLAAGEISEGHARAILGAPTEPQQIRLWERARERNLTVRQVESAAKQLRTPDGAATAERHDAPPGDTLATERLQSALSTKVLIERRRRGGRLVIQWYDDEQLEQIVSRIVEASSAEPTQVPEQFDI
jgi:ParB family chromosome partitioning protein